jgi:hypothetical protein
MKQLLAIAFTTALTIVLHAAGTQEFTTNSLPIPDHGTLNIKAPKGWGFVRKGAINPTGPRTAELKSASGDISVQLTMFWDGINPSKPRLTDEDLTDIVKMAAERQYAPASVEKKTTIEKLSGGKVSGSFARFTDAEWVGKKVPPGEFSNVASGAVRCDDLWGVFTILTNEKDGPKFKQGLAVIESLEKAAQP